MKNLGIRFATAADAEDILAIYAPYIENTAITFEYTVPAITEFRERIETVLTSYPYLVCTVDGKIVGYAYAARHMERAAYQWNAVLSVYIDEQYGGYGLGPLLYETLIDLLKLQNLQNVYGIVTSPNENSEKLHSRLGFSLIGLFHKTGYKFGRWYDVSWWEKFVGCESGIKNLPSFIKIGEIDENDIRTVIDRHLDAFRFK
ncbi:GNAT family N-acetyltransferase [Coprobacter tertius]|uniref:GNAT family N-acetyltransferase n=1 Tax=Coprobacter tertius TaxID=2944915 RepID=A0ABT1MFI5_9BACT|nr:GNAT family N-acetyltransferase [Coprobacter tertius]MCP9611397.1 GNAT family N-acetyltransferase [Coprobacter tertius]